MKVRMDFVTNSSSSSYLIARKHNCQMSQESRDKLADILVQKFVNRVRFIKDLTVENVRTHETTEDISEETTAKIVAALKDGFQVGEGYISWEDAEDTLSEIAEQALKVVDNDDAYRVIEADLTY